MAENNPIEEKTMPEGVVSQTPEEDAWFAGMEGKYPEHKGNREAIFKASREGYDREHKLNKENAEDYGKIYNAIEKSPEVAAFINKVTEPEEGAEPEEAYAALGENLVDLLTGKIDAPAYRAKKKQMAEESAAAQAKKDALEQSAGEAFVGACKELGLNEDEAYASLMKKYGNEDGEFLADQTFYTALLKSLTYEDDMLAAEARGRNAQMAERNQRRSTKSDGLPRSMGSAPAEVKSQDPNSLASVYARRASMNK